VPERVRRTMRVNALRVEQRADVPLYVFGINGRLIPQFASVEAANRSAEGVLSGYQRARVQRHISEIHAYLARDDAILPNAIVLALREKFAFEPISGALRNEWGTLGCLLIPVVETGDPKPCVIVDGQQRVSALSQLDPKRTFPVIVVAFQSASEKLQREQFVLVNKTKPLPRDLLNELLPHLDTAVTKTWQVRRIAAGVVEKLRFDRGSPFYGRIRGIGSLGEGCNISQAAVLGVVERSIRRGGGLASYVSNDFSVSDVVGMAQQVSVFFQGVRSVWPSAWEGSPRSSRLVHGVGIAALGRLMDEIMPEVQAGGSRVVSMVVRRLQRVDSRCAWTAGRWPQPLACAWDDLENTSQDKRRLGEYLVREYKRARHGG